MTRVIVGTVAVLICALLFPQAAVADGPISVDCGDGSPILANVDLTTLADLEGSIQGMIDYPSGTSCSISNAVQLDPTLALGISGGNPFVVGGGRYDRGPGPGSSQGCGVNFSLNAHADKSGFHGQQNYTINNADGCRDFGLQGHVKANVTCLDVALNAAQIKGTVTEVTGGFIGLVAVGDVLESDVIDNGPPSGPNPDRIDVFADPPGTGLTCLANSTAFFPVENGNITVHN
jgi:hypothetical protein